MMNVNIFVDMDGVLAEYHPRVVDYMYEKGFFKNRPPMMKSIEIVRELIKKDYNVFILSSVIDSIYCIDEKVEWLNKMIPELPRENQIYVPYGKVKSDYAQKFVDTKNSVNVLIDDYTVNLDNWTLDGALPIKLLNQLNNTKGTWLSSGGQYICYQDEPEENLRKIIDMIESKRHA